MSDFKYVKALSLEERILFVKLIASLISNDGKIDENERLFINDLAYQYKIPKEYIDKVNQRVTFEQLLQQATNMLNRKKSLYLIKELLSVANTDNDFSDDEIDYVVKVAKALNVEDNKVTELNQLIVERLDWLERYYKAMEDEV